MALKRVASPTYAALKDIEYHEFGLRTECAYLSASSSKSRASTLSIPARISSKDEQHVCEPFLILGVPQGIVRFAVEAGIEGKVSL